MLNDLMVVDSIITPEDKSAHSVLNVSLLCVQYYYANGLNL